MRKFLRNGGKFMPTYLYECENCGRFEEFQRISEKPLTNCPTCQGETKRIIGAPGIIFKGSGFYCTDSKQSNNLAGSDNGNKKEETKKSKETKNDKNDKKEKKDKTKKSTEKAS